MSAIGTKRTSAVRCTCLLLTQSRHWLVSPPLEYYRGLIRCPVLSLGGGNETARQSRRQSSKNATPQDVEAPQCAKERPQPQVLRCPPGNRGCAANPRAARGTRAAGGDFGSSGRDQFFARRAWGCLRGHTRKRHTHLRWQTCHLFLYSKHEHAFRLAAQRNAPAAYAERWAKNPVLRIGENPRNPLARLAKTKRVLAIPDLMVEPGYINREPRFVALVEAAGARTRPYPDAPGRRANRRYCYLSPGSTAVYRQTDRTVQNFAEQAVIAIENARLLKELRQRTADLTESLEQQTATSEVLGVISSSPGELEPVFEAMLSNATRLCEAEFGVLNLYDGEVFRPVATHNVPPAFAELRRSELHSGRRREARMLA